MSKLWLRSIGCWLWTGKFNGVRRENQNRQHQEKVVDIKVKVILKYNAGRRCWIKYDPWRVYKNCVGMTTGRRPQ